MNILNEDRMDLLNSLINICKVTHKMIVEDLAVMLENRDFFVDIIEEYILYFRPNIRNEIAVLRILDNKIHVSVNDGVLVYEFDTIEELDNFLIDFKYGTITAKVLNKKASDISIKQLYNMLDDRYKEYITISQVKDEEHYITIEKHLDIKSYDIKIIDNHFSVISYDTIGKPTIENFNYYYKLIHFLDNNLSN
ncbi:MAG TPA: hypothetical protein K8V77_01870 [Brachyspira hyodysenteriae]|nr:hypothetical protein [Brachyspira hyodysenteriae]